MAEPKMFGKYQYQTEPGTAAAIGKPSRGPVYRFIAAQQGFTELPSNLHSLYEVFQQSVTQHPDNDCLGRRVDGKGEFVFESYRVNLPPACCLWSAAQCIPIPIGPHAHCFPADRGGEGGAGSICHGSCGTGGTWPSGHLLCQLP